MLNQPDATNSFWKDEELKSYINEAVRMYFAEISDLVEGQFTAFADLDIVANQELIALPADFFEVKALYKSISNGYVNLQYMNNLNMDYSKLGGGNDQSFFPVYYFQNNNLVLRPIPNFSETAGLRLEYLQFPDTLINGGDVLSSGVSPIFKQVIEMYAVYKAKLKESMVSGVVMHVIPEQHLASLTKKFKETVERRSHSITYVQPFNPEHF
jgi:hypothetical protein